MTNATSSLFVAQASLPV